ncbi:MAG: tail fiber domain-containing protein [Acidobacteria bacterium]|nr:tail fiber domain-containing protein [Acidobacteriota bacterium]
MKPTQRVLASTLAAALVASLTVFPAHAAERTRIADTTNFSDGVAFDARTNAGMTLTVTGPQDFVAIEELAAGASAFFDTTGLADGFYRWELRTQPALDASTKAALDRARQTGDESTVNRLRAQGKLTSGDVQSGVFTIQGGAIVDDTLVEHDADSAGARAEQAGDGIQAASGAALSNLSDATQVITMDLVVQGSECVGTDCSTSPSFGFDTLRLKENNLRIKFDDTSSSGSFPNNDWQLTANDTNNGGANKFSLDDITNGKTPFTIEAGAANNSLYVDDAGNIGIGTSAPVVEVHVVDGDSPALRLQQDASSGFTPYVWDVAGNETNFFVRDVTDSSHIPFKIFPGANTNMLTVTANDRVGIATTSPAGTLGVQTSDANSLPAVYAKSTATSGAQDMLQLEATGDVNIRTNFTGNTGATAWLWRQTYRANQYNLELDGGNQFILDNTGELTVTGDVNAVAFNTTSDRNAKENFSSVEPNDILDRLAQIPVQKWNFKNDQGETQHIGPMAQDFYAAFGVGMDDRHIATVDADGVAFAAIQALNQRLLDAVQRLEAENKTLAERLSAIEAMEP